MAKILLHFSYPSSNMMPTTIEILKLYTKICSIELDQILHNYCRVYLKGDGRSYPTETYDCNMLGMEQETLDALESILSWKKGNRYDWLDMDHASEWIIDFLTFAGGEKIYIDLSSEQDKYCMIFDITIEQMKRAKLAKELQK